MATPAPHLIDAVRGVLDDTEAEYAQMPFFVRPMVRRGFVSRTGRDVEGWRRWLAELARAVPPGADADLERLAEHYRGAPARAQRGMGASGPQLAEVEARSARRVAAVLALRDGLR